MNLVSLRICAETTSMILEETRPLDLSIENKGGKSRRNKIFIFILKV